MKKRVIVLTLLIAILVTLIVLMFSLNLKFTGNVILTPTLPTDCSDASIKAVWDSVFQESSDSITIFKNNTYNKCIVFAYKININETYILNKIEKPFNQTLVRGIHANFTQNAVFLSNLKNIFGVDEYGDPIPDISGISNSDLIPRNTSLSEATSRYNTYFRISPSNWRIDYASYISNDSFKNLTEEINVEYMIHANYSIDYYIFGKKLILPCTPNWTAYNTSCQSNEKLTTYFIDSNNCNQASPTNLSLGCDYDNNGIINSDVNLSGTILSLFINSQPVNTSENYIGKIYKVELKSGSNSVLEFDWNFSQPLNLENVYLEKQPSSATRGYLIIKGLNVRKKVFIDKLNSSSSSVCVKDQELNSIVGISLSCTGTNEYEVDCPGSNDNFTCNLPAGFFEVDGLTNSGVIEMQYRTINISCTPNWNCTSWSPCSEGRQNRTCRDLNLCNISMPFLNQNQSCSQIGNCTPNWNCTNWSLCINGSQTKTCIDLNNCNTATGKPDTIQSCTQGEKGYNLIIISIIIGIIILIIIIVILLIYFLNKGENQDNSSSIPPIPPSPFYSPPQYTSSHPTYSQNMQNRQF